MKKGLILSTLCLLFANIKAHAQNSCDIYIKTKEQIQKEFLAAETRARLQDYTSDLLPHRRERTAEEKDLQRHMVEKGLEDPAIAHRISAMRGAASKDYLRGYPRHQDHWVEALMAVYKTTGLNTVSDFKFAEALIRALNHGVWLEADQLHAIAKRRHDEMSYSQDMDALAEFYLVAYLNRNAYKVFKDNIHGRKGDEPLTNVQLMAELRDLGAKEEMRESLGYLISRHSETTEQIRNKVIMAGLEDRNLERQILELGRYAEAVTRPTYGGRSIPYSWQDLLILFDKYNALGKPSDFKLLQAIMKLRQHLRDLPDEVVESLLKIRNESETKTAEIDAVAEAYLLANSSEAGRVTAVKLKEIAGSAQ